MVGKCLFRRFIRICLESLPKNWGERDGVTADVRRRAGKVRLPAVYPQWGRAKNSLHRAREAGGLVYWTCELPIIERRTQYHFYIATENCIYFYTQKEITTYLPEHSYDFVLLTDYVQPAWVKDAVFYQIFPERFCNGDPSNDVKTGEYSQDGFPAIHMEHWDDTPLTYEQGHCMDFYGGDLQGIRQKIPYLKELGVTAVYLNPIFYAPSCHKYDCLDYFHVDPHFGGDEALAELSKALHENGMKLILDISINHTGTGHRWFNKDGAYFPKPKGPTTTPIPWSGAITSSTRTIITTAGGTCPPCPR